MFPRSDPARSPASKRPAAPWNLAACDRLGRAPPGKCLPADSMFAPESIDRRRSTGTTVDPRRPRDYHSMNASAATVTRTGVRTPRAAQASARMAAHQPMATGVNSARLASNRIRNVGGPPHRWSIGRCSMSGGPASVAATGERSVTTCWSSRPIQSQTAPACGPATSTDSTTTLTRVRSRAAEPRNQPASCSNAPTRAGGPFALAEKVYGQQQAHGPQLEFAHPAEDVSGPDEERLHRQRPG